MYVRFPCQVFPISDCDVGRATGAASISWVPKYELTCSQFRIMVTVVGALGAAPGMREVLGEGLPLRPSSGFAVASCRILLGELLPPSPPLVYSPPKNGGCSKSFSLR